MLGDTYNKKTEREVTYTVRETWHGSSTVSRSGSFDSVEEALSAMQEWEPVKNNGLREVIKRTRVVTVETTEEVVSL